MYADVKGGLWYETFAGVLQCGNLEVISDNEWKMSPSFLSIWPLYVHVKWGKKPGEPILGHAVEIRSYVLGLNSLNPIMWLSMAPLSVGFGYFLFAGPLDNWLAKNKGTFKGKLFTPFEEEEEALVA